MAQKPREFPPHSDEFLRLAFDYFEYHLHMYTDTAIWLESRQPRYPDWERPQRTLEYNAVLESCLLHTRVIAEFLYAERRQFENDVIALDYFHDAPPSRCYNPKAYSFPGIDDFISGVGKCVAHITTAPMPKLTSDVDWKLWPMASPLFGLFGKFRVLVPPSRVDAAHVDACLAHFDRLGEALGGKPPASFGPTSGFSVSTAPDR